MLLERYAGRLEYHEPWHLEPRGLTPVPRPRRRPGEVDELLAERGHGDLRLVDNGVVNRRSEALAELAHVRGYHLVPAGRVEGRRGRVPPARARLRARGDVRGGRLARGPRVRGRGRDAFWLVANAVERDPSMREAVGVHPNVRVAEAGHGSGVYEAVVGMLMGGPLGA
jgi:hypothetical protein